jgi:hypothetical protein
LALGENPIRFSSGPTVHPLPRGELPPLRSYLQLLAYRERDAPCGRLANAKLDR